MDIMIMVGLVKLKIGCTKDPVVYPLVSDIPSSGLSMFLSSCLLLSYWDITLDRFDSLLPICSMYGIFTYI